MLFLKRIYIAGLTIEELTPLINQELEQYLNIPNVNIKINVHRCISIYIDGEIANPWLYYFAAKSLQDNKNIPEELSMSRPITLTNTFPRIYDAIKVSGGITNYSDLFNIQITRMNSISKGGGWIKTNLVLMRLISEGDNTQNIQIFDGDRLFIPKGNISYSSALSKTIKSNTNPKYIRIYIGVRVENKGFLEITKTLTASEAILIAEMKSIRGKVRLFRLEGDGVIQKNSFRFNNNKEKDKIVIHS